MRDPNYRQEEMLDRLSASFNLPDDIKTPKDFREAMLEDLFFLCSFVLRHGKRVEYRDMNQIHMQLCDFLTHDPNPQKLVLMSRDSLKSTIGRGGVLQQFLKHSYGNDEALLGVVTGLDPLSKEHLGRIIWEILHNEMIQAFFAGYIPRKANDAAAFSSEEVRWRKVGIDTGSLKKSLTGRHYRGVWNDNMVNEINSQTSDLRKYVVTRWRQQESILAEDAWEWVFETPWEADDLSGLILDPDGKFNYKSICRKSPAIFVAETGYSVFSCFVRNEKGELNFPEKLDEAYLARKKRKQGHFIYQRMYEGQIVSDEDVVFKSKDLVHFDALPSNYIRNMVIDCAGTKKKDSSYSAISIMDWDAAETGYIDFAAKRKLSSKELEDWACELYDKSGKDGRPIYQVGVEWEKFGITFYDRLSIRRPDINLVPIYTRGRPRHVRLFTLTPLYENRKIQSRRGLKEYEEERESYRRGNDENVDILDTIAYQAEIRLIPRKMPDVLEFEPVIEDAFVAQLKKEVQGRLQANRPLAAGF